MWPTPELYTLAPSKQPANVKPRARAVALLIGRSVEHGAKKINNIHTLKQARTLLQRPLEKKACEIFRSGSSVIPYRLNIGLLRKTDEAAFRAQSSQILSNQQTLCLLLKQRCSYYPLVALSATEDSFVDFLKS